MRLLALISLACTFAGPAFTQTTPIVADLNDSRAGDFRFDSVTTSPREVFHQYASGQKKRATPGAVWARLMLPSGPGPFPVVTVSHGTGGYAAYGNRMEDWGATLNKAGVAALLLDHFTHRGLKDTDAEKGAVSDWTVAADIILAGNLLATHPKIDAKRMGTMGFSLGGQGARIAALEKMQDTFAKPEARMSLFMPGYPGCMTVLQNVKYIQAPMYYLLAGKDDLAPAAQCQYEAEYNKGRGQDVHVIVYPTAYHGFDGFSKLTRSTSGKAQNFSKCFTMYDPQARTQFRIDTKQPLDIDKGEAAAYAKSCVTNDAYYSGTDNSGFYAVRKDVAEIVKRHFNL